MSKKGTDMKRVIGMFFALGLLISSTASSMASEKEAKEWLQVQSRGYVDKVARCVATLSNNSGELQNYVLKTGEVVKVAPNITGRGGMSLFISVKTGGNLVRALFSGDNLDVSSIYDQEGSGKYMEHANQVAAALRELLPQIEPKCK